MRAVLLVLALTACTEVRQVNRWPNHRKEKDAQITELEDRIHTLEQHVVALEAALAKLSQPHAAPPAPAPAAVPSPGS